MTPNPSSVTRGVGAGREKTKGRKPRRRKRDPLFQIRQPSARKTSEKEREAKAHGDESGEEKDRPFSFSLVSSYSFFQSSLFAAREEISARGWNSECNFRAKTAPACIFPDRDSLSDYQSTGNYRLLGCFIEDGKWVHLVVINYSSAV